MGLGLLGQDRTPPVSMSPQSKGPRVNVHSTTTKSTDDDLTPRRQPLINMGSLTSRQTLHIGVSSSPWYNSRAAQRQATIAGGVDTDLPIGSDQHSMAAGCFAWVLKTNGEAA